MNYLVKSAIKKGVLGFSYFIGNKIKGDFKLSPEERVITYPTMGRKNTNVIKKHLEGLGMNILLPPPTTDRTIKIGVRNSPDMMCFPYKVTLGNFVEALEEGANTLVIFNSSGRCRFRQYSKLHEYTLRGMGYNFEIHNVSISDIIPKLSKLSGKSLSKSYNAFSEYLKETKEIDSEVKQWSKDKPNIGIIGEIFCACDEKINYGLESKIKKFGGNPYNTAKVGDFLSDLIKRKLKIYDSSFFDYVFREPLKDYKKEAKKFFNGELGGHAFENIYNLLFLADRGVDGIIHILPLSCMPESTIEPYIDGICRDRKIPKLRLHIDETNSPANIETRLETFVELIKWKRKKHT